MMFAVDTHVHLYPAFDFARLLQSAWGVWNRTADASRIALEAGMLCLTEGKDAGAFERLRKDARSGSGGSFPSIRPTAEDTSLRVDGLKKPLFLIRGRQIVTREGLEVLAVGTAASWPDRHLTLEEIVPEIVAADGIPIIPWGAGKWWGQRGARLSHYLNRAERPDVFLGDNGGRPRFWSRPAHFRMASRLGIPVIPGSDPLPIPGEESTAGRCFIVVQGHPNPRAPAQSLREGLRSRNYSVAVPAGMESAMRFLANQFRRRMKK